MKYTGIFAYLCVHVCLCEMKLDEIMEMCYIVRSEVWKCEAFIFGENHWNESCGRRSYIGANGGLQGMDFFRMKFLRI